MNPENLNRATAISFELKDIDSDIEFLEEYYLNGEFKRKFDFDLNGQFYRLYVGKDDIKALIEVRKNQRENLMKELEEL